MRACRRTYYGVINVCLRLIGQPLATVQLSYREANKSEATTSKLDLPFVSAAKASVGLRRGELLVNEYLGLKGAMTAHLVENNREKAHRLLAELNARLTSSSDQTLGKERQLVGSLHKSMSQLTGHGGQASVIEEEKEDTFICGNAFLYLEKE